MVKETVIEVPVNLSSCDNVPVAELENVCALTICVKNLMGEIIHVEGLPFPVEVPEEIRVRVVAVVGNEEVEMFRTVLNKEKSRTTLLLADELKKVRIYATSNLSATCAVLEIVVLNRE